MSRTVTTRDGDMVDLVALAAYGATGATTEAILDANPGLAAFGPVLPAGVVVVLPDIAVPPPASTIMLWD